MEVTATVAPDYLSFNCPSCQTPYSVDKGLPTTSGPLFAVPCERCGVTFSVRNPSAIAVAASPVIAAATVAGVMVDAPMPQAQRFCVKCGTRLEASQAFCAACGTPAAGAGPSASELGQKIAASAGDALTAFRKLLTDPVAGLAPSYETLGPQRAQAAGVALCLFFALAGALGAKVGATRIGGALAFAGEGGATVFFKITFVFLVIALAITLVSLAVRKVFRATGPVTADVFTAGAALSPLGVVILVIGVLGIDNFQIIGVLMMFAWAYLLLMLFTGLSRIGGLSEQAAAPMVPVVLLLSGWLSKIVFAALLS